MILYFRVFRAYSARWHRRAGSGRAGLSARQTAGPTSLGG